MSLDLFFFVTSTFVCFLRIEAGSNNKGDKTKSCEHQSHEGIFISENDEYMVSFCFGDKGLKVSLLN